MDELEKFPTYDYVISMYSPIARVIDPIRKIPAKNRMWILEPFYEGDIYINNDQIIKLNDINEYSHLYDEIKTHNFQGCNILIDSTGFYIPILLYLLRVLYSINVCRFDVLYTEPDMYSDAEETMFSEDFVEVSGVEGMTGINTSNMSNDLLIIASGYDHSRIADVANDKRNAKKILMFGFPALSPIMFQENILRVYRAEPILGMDCFKDLESNLYAPASDPFVTAQTIHDYIKRQKELQQNNIDKEFSNIYMAPLSTKPMAIGMGLYYLWEKGWENNISIIYPFCRHNIVDNSKGISKIWKYEFMLPAR